MRTAKQRAALRDLLADYGVLLYEASYMLAALGEAESPDRLDELDVLAEVCSEATSKHRELSHVVAYPAPPAAGWSAAELHALLDRLQQMVDDILRIGTMLTHIRLDRLPENVLEQVHLVQGLSRLVSESVESLGDPVALQRCAEAVHHGATTNRLYGGSGSVSSSASTAADESAQAGDIQELIAARDALGTEVDRLWDFERLLVTSVGMP